MINDNIGTLFEGDPSAPAPMALRQGVVESWDTDTGENSIQIAGGTLVNLPSLTAEAAELVAGDVVALLSVGDRALVLGKVTTPGDPGTVPTWNADLTALAPLVPIAEMTSGTTITGVTQETSGTGPRVVINDPAYPGEIVLYTGSPEEIEPARLKPIVSGSSYLRLIGPKTSVPDAPTTVDLYATDLGGSGFQVDADQQHLFATNMTINGFTLLKLGDGTDYISIVGQAVTDADLSDPSNIFPTEPFYNAYLNANQSIPNNTATTITGWVADGSPNSEGITRSSGVFTVPKAGRYRLRAQVWWSAIASPTGVRTAQWKNAALSVTYASHTAPPNATTAHPNRIEKTVRLAAGDQVVLQVLQTQGASVNAVGSTADLTYAQIEWVGP